MRKQLLITSLVVGFTLLSSLSSFAAKLKGVVVDEKNEPLPGVTVVVRSLEKGTQTDPDGHYEIDGLEDGTYEVLFTMMTYKKSLQTVTVSKGRDVELNATLKEEGRNLKEVTVKAAKLSNTESAVIMEIRKSNSLVSAISAQQISKTMDRNAADVVKRIPGVTIMDDKFIMVRGLNDRYNTVWLNDAAAPSSEVDKKAFSFDVIPSGQIDRIVIAKTPAPELPGDFAGGMVKIYTTSIPDKNTYTLGFQGSSREYTTGRSFNYNEPSKTDWLGYDDGKRALPTTVPEMDEYNADKILKRSNPDIENISKSFKNNWAVKTKNAAPDMRLNLSASNTFKLSKRLRLGNTFAVNYSNTYSNYWIDRRDWDDTTLQLHQRDQQSVNNVSCVLMDNVGVAWGNNKIEFKNLFNQIGRSSLVDRYNIPDTVKHENIQHDYVMTYESRRLYAAQLAGSHKNTDDSRKYSWALGYADLFKNLPDLKRIRYTKDYGSDDSTYKAAIAAQPEANFGGGRIYAKLMEKTFSFSHQLSQKIRISNYEFEVSLGNYIESKERRYNLRQFAYSIPTIGVPAAIRTAILRQPIDKIFAEETLGGKNQLKVEESTHDYDLYNAKNMLVASFLALKLPVGTKFTAYGGVRHEYNEYKLTAIANLQELKPVVKTNFILPSINLAYNITDKQILRVAYGKTLNRPEFRENSPFFFYDLENRWGIYGSMAWTEINKGGDTLKVAQVNNIDARWEWYPSSSEMVQLGVFYKDLKDPIQQVINDPIGETRSYTFANLISGYSYGLEVDIRKNLSFADDWVSTNFFRNLSFVGNLALIRSEVTPDTNIKVKNKNPIQGQSPYMYNAGLYYQDDSLGLQLSVLYNVFGPRIFALGAPNDIQRVGNIWELPFQALDITVSKKFVKFITLSFGIQNLLNQKVRMAQDVDFDNKITGDTEAITNIDKSISSYRPGRYFTVGLKIKI